VYVAIFSILFWSNLNKLEIYSFLSIADSNSFENSIDSNGGKSTLSFEWLIGSGFSNQENPTIWLLILSFSKHSFF
jgi:hypothetical protein